MDLLDVLFPRKCLACRRFLKSPLDPLCPSCEENWPACAEPLRKSFCREIYAAGVYKGFVHDLIVRLKYRGEERLSSFLGRRMAEKVSRTYDVIVPIPLHRKRLRERGYNQSLLLARSVGKVLKTDVDPFVLVKTRETPSQMGLKGEERRINLKKAFGLRREEWKDKIEGKTILLVDDVCTTGTTLDEASKALLSQGAKRVEGLVLARAVIS